MCMHFCSFFMSLFFSFAYFPLSLLSFILSLNFWSLTKGCNVTALNRTLYRYTRNVQSYDHVQTSLCVYRYALSGSLILLQPPRGKCLRTRKSQSLFSDTNVYSLLHFLSIRREKEREYKSWVDCVSRTKKKKTICHKERKRRLT